MFRVYPKWIPRMVREIWGFMRCSEGCPSCGRRLKLRLQFNCMCFRSNVSMGHLWNDYVDGNSHTKFQRDSTRTAFSPFCSAARKSPWRMLEASHATLVFVKRQFMVPSCAWFSTSQDSCRPCAEERREGAGFHGAGSRSGHYCYFSGMEGRNSVPQLVRTYQRLHPRFGGVQARLSLRVT